MKKAAAIVLILAMTLSLGACGGKDSSKADPAPKGGETSSVSAEAGGTAQESAAEAAGINGTEAAGINGTDAAGMNVTDPAGANTTAAGGNTTESTAGTMPVMLDPPSMKTAYQPETEDQKYAREITGIYLLTDLKDTLSDETGDKAAQLEAEGSPMYMEFFSNGTLRETVFGDPMGGLWDREYLTLGSDRVPYEFSGDHLTVTTDNMTLTFTRTTKDELDLLLGTGGDDAGSDGDEEGTDGNEDSAGGENGTGKTKKRVERIITRDTKDDEEETAESVGEEITEGNGEETAEEGEGEITEDEAAADEYVDEELSEDPYETQEDPAAQQQMEEYIISDNLCSMTATGYDFSDPRGFVIHVRCENYSVNNMAFNIQEAVVNNVMFEPGTLEGDDHWSLEVEPLSTRESDILFSAEKAAEYGITSFDYVMFNLWVRDMDNWLDDPIYQGDGELYPTDNVSGKGIQTLERRSAAGEQKIAEDSKFNFTILGSEIRENGDFVLKACIENKTWANLTFSWDDVYVNGTLLDPFWAVETLSGTICYDDIVFRAEDLEEKGVSVVSDVTFTMSVWDSKNWLSYPIYTETSTYRA